MRGLSKRLDIDQLNIDYLLALLIFAIIGHDTETEAYNELISCFLEELF